MKKIINRLVDRFLFSMMICVSFNLVAIVSVILLGSGPELLASVLHGWDGLDFLAVMFLPSIVGAVLLVIGDLTLKKFYEIK
jgi:hypothetical protein|tara:strand:- start:2 stop:247 length:246 start_codon:yes stop_codon:yes gene_type:complete